MNFDSAGYPVQASYDADPPPLEPLQPLSVTGELFALTVEIKAEVERFFTVWDRHVMLMRVYRLEMMEQELVDKAEVRRQLTYRTDTNMIGARARGKEAQARAEAEERLRAAEEAERLKRVAEEAALAPVDANQEAPCEEAHAVPQPDE